MFFHVHQCVEEAFSICLLFWGKLKTLTAEVWRGFHVLYSRGKIMANKPIAYIVGDDTVARVGKLLRDHLNFPCTLIDLSVENRAHTQDACIQEAVTAIRSSGAGFKESTASDRSKQHNQASANIVLRPATGAYAMERILTLPSKYQNVCGVMRYGHGGIYDVLNNDPFFPQHNVVRGIYPEGHQLQGEEYIIEPVITNLSGLDLIAVKAAKVARLYGLRLFVSSKWTICDSEEDFLLRISRKWTEMGIEFLDDKNVSEHTPAATFKRKLTDIMEAEMTLSHMSEGGFLAVMPNAPGDSASDIVDLEDGSRSMSSTVHCRGNFSYEELPGGTAPDKCYTDLVGSNFFNPFGMISGVISTVVSVNPELEKWGDAVRQSAAEYLAETPKGDRSTEAMIQLLPSLA